ncbi:hypothetical protein CHUAL_012735 [Chamberlinius hualienensis]
MADLANTSKPSILLYASIKFWGSEITPAWTEFKQNAVPIDMSKDLEPSTTITSHLTYKDYVVTETLGRGAVEAAQRLKLKENDILLAALMKTGSTWVQEILYNLMHPDELETPSTVPVDLRVPLIELPECGLEAINERSSPRLVKSHLPYQLLPSGTCDKGYKIVYVIRNVKDTAVSTYHFYKMLAAAQFNGTLKEFLNLYLKDKTLYAPCSKHILSYWNNRHLPNIHIIKYEDMQKNVVHEIRRLAKFLGVDDAAAKKVAEKCSFNQMAQNPNSHHGQWVELQKMKEKSDFGFMRKGKVGDWKNCFDEETNKKFDDWTAKCFANSDITFDYEI